VIAGQRTGAAARPSLRSHRDVGAGAQSRVSQYQAPSREDLRAAAAEIEKEFDFMQTRVSFQIDPESEEPVFRVVDRQSGEVIRQLPPEDLLKIRAAFREVVRGLLLDREA